MGVIFGKVMSVYTDWPMSVQFINNKICPVEKRTRIRCAGVNVRYAIQGGLGGKGY
jgi:hypothetical protein